MFEINTRWGWFRGLGMTISSACVFWANSTYAQITPDRTLPNNSRVITTDNIRTIEGGTNAGSNLFHSFEEFSVPNGTVAYFNNASNIQNIINRVTGSSTSKIDGLIRANSTANLFLLNPHGIIFGQGARLDIGGSFVATTANGIQFGEQGFFSASEPGSPQLLTVNPSALLFNQIAAQPLNSIESQAFLSVPTGRSLLLVGGNVSPNTASTGQILLSGGRLRAPGGRVEIGGLTEPGKVNLNTDGQNFSLGFFQGINRADVSLVNLAEIDVTAGGSGSISIYAQNLNILDGSDICAGIGADEACGKLASDIGSAGSQAGDITLNALKKITIADQISEVNNNVNPGAVGNSGNINIQAESLSITDNAQISARTFGQGNAGNVNIIARDQVFMDKTYVRSEVRESAEGNGGDINISTGFLDLRNGAELIATNFGGKGDAGNVNIVARDTISFDGTDSEGFPSGAFSNLLNDSVGNGGDINISTGSLYLTNGAELVATNFAGKGDAGSVNIVARDLVSFDGRGRGGFPSGSFSNVLARGVGNGGEINITTGSLSVSNGAVLNAFTSGKGNAGRVNIVARDTVTLDNGKILSSVEPTGVGNSGGIKITTNSISITNEGELRATNLGQGNAGDIQVNSSLIRLDNQAGIRSQTTSGNGGNISLEVRDLLLLRRGSEISTTAGTAGAGGNGGNITINAPNGFIVAASNENSDITANAFSGSGGRVTINANNIFGIAPLIRQDLENLRPNDLDPAQLSTNDITAISQQNPSLSGTVELNTPDVDPSQDLVQLPINVVDASQQIDTSCNPGSRQIASSFLITGRGGLPPNPQEFLIHDSVLVDLVNLQPDTENRLHRTVTSQKTTVTFNTPEPIVEANTWVKNDKGEVVLMSNLPTAAPHNPWLTSASCRSFY